MNKSEALKKFWADVRAGRREAPKRQRNGVVRRILNVQLDGSFGPDRNKRIIVSVHPNGVIELRPERTRRSEKIHAVDAYRYAIKCRVNKATLEKARAKKAKKNERLARLRQERAEKRLVWRE